LSTVYGINLATNTATGIADYGVKIAGPTGAATSNLRTQCGDASGATHNSGITIGPVVTTSGTWALYSAAANNSYFAGNVAWTDRDGCSDSALDLKASAAPTLQIEPWAPQNQHR